MDHIGSTAIHDTVGIGILGPYYTYTNIGYPFQNVLQEKHPLLQVIDVINSINQNFSSMRRSQMKSPLGFLVQMLGSYCIVLEVLVKLEERIKRSSRNGKYNSLQSQSASGRIHPTVWGFYQIKTPLCINLVDDDILPLCHGKSNWVLTGWYCVHYPLPTIQVIHVHNKCHRNGGIHKYQLL